MNAKRLYAMLGMVILLISPYLTNAALPQAVENQETHASSPVSHKLWHN